MSKVHLLVIPDVRVNIAMGIRWLLFRYMQHVSQQLLLLYFQILQYDIRSDKPTLVKDHQYGLSIESIAFQESQDLVLSMDKRILKIWNRNTVLFALNVFRWQMRWDWLPQPAMMFLKI